MKSIQVQTELVVEESCSRQRMQDLPDELLILVFSFLGLRDLVLGARRVCQRWKAVADDESLWKTRVLTHATYEAEVALQIVGESPNLRHVEIHFGLDLRVFFKAIAKHCRELRGINGGCNIENNVDEVEAVIEHCPKLEHVDIRGSLANPRNFLSLVGKCRNLKKLRLHFETPETGIFDPITEGCPMLQSLDVRDSWYRHHDLSCFMERKGHQLTELYFCCCIADADRHCVLPDIARCCRRLEVLHIIAHEGSLQSLNSFFECGNGQNLRDLSLRDFNTNEELCTSAFQFTPNLTSLDLSPLEIRNEHLEGIGKLSNLTVLELESLIVSSDDAVTNITRCKKLKKLFLPHLEGTDEDFMTFCNELPHLEELYIWSTELTATSLLLVSDHLRNLRILYVCGQDLEEAVVLIEKRMPFLRINVSRN